MRVLSLLLGVVLGFVIAAGFYGGGGALTIAAKQIGPDILLQGDVHTEGSGRTVEPGSAPSSPRVGSLDDTSEGGVPTANSPPAVTQKNTAPSTIGNRSIFQVRLPK